MHWWLLGCSLPIMELLDYQLNYHRNLSPNVQEPPIQYLNDARTQLDATTDNPNKQEPPTSLAEQALPVVAIAP